VITGWSRSVSVLDHQTGSIGWIARGQVDALITDIAGDARITRVNRHAMICRPRGQLTVTVGVEEDQNVQYSGSGEAPRQGPGA
jgi:hypothetical protein